MVIDTERKKKRIERWGKMTQSINCPLCKYKDPSVGSQHPHKRRCGTHLWRGMGHRVRWVPGAYWPESLTNQWATASVGDLVLRNEVGMTKEDTENRLRTFPCISMCTHIHAYTHTQKYLFPPIHTCRGGSRVLSDCIC